MLRYNPRDLPFHSHFLDLIWHGRIGELLEDLQQSEPLWPRRKTWTEGGCLILAVGVQDWMLSSFHVHGSGPPLPHGLLPLLSTDFSCTRASPLRPKRLAVWESWDEKPYHVVVTLGSVCVDGDGVSTCDALLMSWEDYFRGGAYLGGLSEQDAGDYGIPRDAALSLRITRELKAAFGPFHTDLLLPTSAGFYSHPRPTSFGMPTA